MTGPALFCVGTSPERARELIAAADPLLVRGPAVAASVWQPFHPSQELNAQHKQRAQDAADAVAEELCERGWDAHPRIYRSDQPAWRALLALGAELSAAVIVAGISDEQELAHGGLGREVRGLAHHADRPLLAVPASWPAADPLDPALIAYDDSPSAVAAVDTMSRVLARRPAIVASAWNSVHELAALATIGTASGLAGAGAEELDRSAEETARHVAMNAAGALHAGGWSTSVVTPMCIGSAWPSLVAAAAEAEAAVVITGTRNHSRLSQLLLGSVAEGILRHARRPVLLAPERHAAGT